MKKKYQPRSRYDNMTVTLIFIAFNYASGGYVNIATPVYNTSVCYNIIDDLKATYGKSHTIMTAKCYN